MKPRCNLKVLSMVLATGACLMTLISDLVKERRQEEEIKAEVDRQVTLRLEMKDEES